MQVRFFFLAEGSEMRANCTGKIGMGGIDLGINDRDPDTLAARQPMRIGQMQLLRRILLRIRLGLRTLRQNKEIDWLAACDCRMNRNIVEHSRHGNVAVYAPDVRRPSGQIKANSLLARHVVLPSNGFENIGGGFGFQHDPVLIKACLAGGRLVKSRPQGRAARAACTPSSARASSASGPTAATAATACSGAPAGPRQLKAWKLRERRIARRKISPGKRAGAGALRMQLEREDQPEPRTQHTAERSIQGRIISLRRGDERRDRWS
jgi:hypothetical protein